MKSQTQILNKLVLLGTVKLDNAKLDIVMRSVTKSNKSLLKKTKNLIPNL
jgi:hypothetical protein